MSLSGKVLSDSSVSALRSLLTTIRGLVVIPFITKLLGTGSFGIWATVFAFIGLVTATGTIHLHGSLIRFDTSDGKEQTYSDVLFFSFVLAVFFSALTLLFGSMLDLSILLNGEVSDQTGLILGTSLLLLMTMILKINLNFPRSKDMVKLYEVFRIGRNILETIVLAAIFYLGGSIVIGIFGLVVVTLCLNIFIMMFVFIQYEIPPPEIRNFRKYVKYGLPMVPTALSNRLLSNTDKYLIIYFISPTAVGIYAVSHTLSKFLTNFTTVLNSTLYPSVTKAWDQGQTDELISLYAQIFRYYSIIAIPSFFGLQFLAYQSILVISTAEIAEQGAILVPVLAFGFLLRGYGYPLEYILNSTHDTGLIGKATLIAAAFNVVLNITLIPYFGIFGAAIGTALSQLSAFFILYKYSTRKLRFSIPLGSIGRSAASAIVMFTGLHFITIGVSPLFALFIYPPIGAIIYFITLFILGEFDQSELRKMIVAVRYLANEIKKFVLHVITH